MSEVLDLASMPLHDATLIDLCLDWGHGTCTATVRGMFGGEIASGRITWHQVSTAQIDRSAPWGRSASILEAIGGPSGRFEITMQSGDTIALTADRCEFS